MSTNFRHSTRRSATWRPPDPSQRWTQIDHIAISYRWRGCVQNCRSYWSTSVDSDHALVCSDVVFRYGGHPRRRQPKLDVAKLADPATLSQFQGELSVGLANTPSTGIDDCWGHIRGAMNKAASTSCGSTHHTANHWVSSASLQLLDARRTIPAGSEHNAARKAIKRQITTSLRRDRETWWSQRATEMESAANSGNFRKLFQLIRVTGKN